MLHAPYPSSPPCTLTGSDASADGFRWLLPSRSVSSWPSGATKCAGREVVPLSWPASHAGPPLSSHAREGVVLGPVPLSHLEVHSGERVAVRAALGLKGFSSGRGKRTVSWCPFQRDSETTEEEEPETIVENSIGMLRRQESGNYRAGCACKHRSDLQAVQGGGQSTGAH